MRRCGVNEKCHVEVIIKVFNEMHGDALAPRTMVAGLPWSPEEFVEQAEQLAHPFDEDSPLDEPILRTMFGNLARGPQAVERHRKGTIAHYERRARSLEPQEAALKDKMDTLVREVVGDKKIFLFREVLHDVGHPDVDLAADVGAGFPLLGDLGMSSVSKESDWPAPLSTKEPMTGASWAQESCRASCRSSGVRETDVAVFEGTMEEVKRRWLQGPPTEEQITDLLGPCWVPSRRFGLVQGSKLRLVDDFSEHGVNGATHVREKITLGGVDECVALAKVWASLVPPGGRVECPLRSGEFLQGELHPGWGEDGLKKIVGRTWDPKAAYKQFAVVTAHRYANVVVVFNPEKGEPPYVLRRCGAPIRSHGVGQQLLPCSDGVAAARGEAPAPLGHQLLRRLPDDRGAPHAQGQRRGGVHEVVRPARLGALLGRQEETRL